jgi:hypothetical protein
MWGRRSTVAAVALVGLALVDEPGLASEDRTVHEAPVIDRRLRADEIDPAFA